MINTEFNTSVAGQLKQATETSAQAFRMVSQKVTGRLEALRPPVDPTPLVAGYVALVQELRRQP